MELQRIFRLPDAISRLRRLRGLSQKQLAARCALDPTRLSAMERGRVVGPGIDIAERLAKALGLVGADRDAFLHAASRDRVMREVVRNLQPEDHGLIAASLDAISRLAREDVQEAEAGLRQMVAAKARLQSFSGEEDNMT